MTAEAPKLRDSWPGRVLRWAGWALLLAPVTIVAHEFGHLLVALLLGLPEPALHFSHISHGDISGRPMWQSGLVGIAGPLVTAGFILFAMLWVRRRGADRWAFALAAAAASRFFVGVPYTLAVALAAARGVRLEPPQFDEYKAGEALGASGNLMLLVSTLLFFTAIGWLALRLPRGSRGVAWTGLFIGTVTGWALWFTVGPLLLP
jgi:hypothetical protein